MNASPFSAIPLAPRDPILGLNESFAADSRANKVNLGVGVYYDDNGKLPLLKAVQQAEDTWIAQHNPRGYLPIDGIVAYNSGVQNLLFGNDAATKARAITAQALGGTGALKQGADFLRQHVLRGSPKVVISNPSWENHRALFETAGFEVDNYPYYRADGSLDLDQMLAFWRALPAQTVVVLHGCCHNPTGLDPTPEQWKSMLAVLRERDLIPFVDIAYQGFAEGLHEDAAVVGMLAQDGGVFLVSSSFSKSFSLYGERVGALTVVTSSHDEAVRVLSQLKRVIRTNYSNPPTHGGKLVATVLNTPELFALWEGELSQMRQRIRAMRLALQQQLTQKCPQRSFAYITQQRGMFSYSGMSADQVARLQSEFGIYAVSTGRICVAALNSKNIEQVASAMANVLQG